jgi:hypothetical protein
MDPVLVELLRFGTAILAGGLVAVISAVLTFRYAQRLAEATNERQRRAAELAEARRQRRLRRALLAEVEENIVIGEDQDASQLARMQRSAWDQARSLALPEKIYRPLTEAYAAADRYNGQVEVVLAKLATNHPDAVHNEALIGLERARAALVYFRDAYDHLLELEPDPMDPSDAKRVLDEPEWKP